MDEATHTHDEHSEAGHVVPLPLLAGVLAALLFLTFITVAVTWVDLGALNVWVALLIAAIKAGIVALYFMHLRWDSLFNGIILICALLFVAIFIGITIIDTTTYQHEMEVPRNVTVFQ
jgi:cytochrome c oxidase subunit 4